MTTYRPSIDATPAGQGCKYSFTTGTGGTTAGDAVKLDSSGYVVDCDNAADIAIGVARDTVSAGVEVVVLHNGCIVEGVDLASAYAFTTGGRVGVAVTGKPGDYSSGTYLGFAMSATKLLVQIEH